MAKVPGLDAATSSKEREGFLRDLQTFHETKGTPFRRNPVVGGREVDLHLLYTLVTGQGGWIKVNSKNAWGDLLDHFKLPVTCVNGGIALKQIYLRYLDRWEKVHYLGEEGDRGSDEDEESRHKRWSARALHSVPLSYNYSQHILSDTTREYNHLATELYKPSDYDRLALSLLSPLPNEQDFAINVCTLLSNDGKHTLKLDKHPRIINFLLAHAGVYNHNSIRKLFTHSYAAVRRQPINSFWADVLESEEFLELTNEDKFIPPPLVANKKPVVTATPVKSETEPNPASGECPKIGTCIEEQEQPALPNCDVPMDVDCESATIGPPEDAVCCEVIESTSDCEIVSDSSTAEPSAGDKGDFKVKLKVEPDDKGLFCLGRSHGTQEYVGQRVLQIATILRNLSFIEENVQLLVKNETFVRFLLLCCTSQWAHLKNIGLDMLGNLAPDFVVREYPKDKLSALLIKIVVNGLQSNDRLCCISSLEVLNKLSQNEINEDTLLRNLEASVYHKVCSFLTIHDVMLLIYTLECLYSLSSLGERSCNFIVNTHGVIDTLVSLVTVEGKSYGPRACIGMKLVETVTGIQPVTTSSTSTASSTSSESSSSSSTTLAAVTTTVSSAPTVTTTSMSTPIVSTSLTSKVASPTTPARVVSLQPHKILQSTPVLSSPMATPAPPSNSQATLQPMTPQQLMQQQHAHQQAIHENEQFALAWLRATYEPCATGKIDHQELYKHYMNSCAKIGRKGVISPLHFPRCVRSVFGGTVGPNPMKPSNPNDPQYYEGIKVRDKPLIINVQPSSSPSSPYPFNKNNNRRKQQPTQTVTNPTTIQTTPQQLQQPQPQPLQQIQQPQQLQQIPSPLNISPDSNDSSANTTTTTTITAPASPASPILKAQLSAPPKQREVAVVSTPCSKSDTKSQVMSHPHLSQALLGTTTTTSMAMTSLGVKQEPLPQLHQGQPQSSTSLIKSLLATKVNDCMSTVSMRTTTDCQNVAQVAARQQQQRLLAQQTMTSTPDAKMSSPVKIETPKLSRPNGARQLFNDSEIGDSSVSSTSQFTSSIKGKKEPPQPPPPPLAPLTTLNKTKMPRIDNEDSDSLGNNSLASSTGIGAVTVGGISSTEECENSLTSFEELLNGIPTMDNPMNEDSNSKDSVKIIGTNEISKNKPLRLADLLEKKFDKAPPLLNGGLNKELRLGEKTLDLVENHIEKALTRDNEISVCNEISDSVNKNNVADDKEEKHGVKRPASDDLPEPEPKKPLLTNNVNGSASTADSPAPESLSSSNGDDGPSTVSTAAAKLFADIAADILEDEDEEQLLQEAQGGAQQQPVVEATIQPSNPMPQIIVDGNQQMILAQPRQIIVTQAPMHQQQSPVVFSQGTPVKTQSGQTVIVQNSASSGHHHHQHQQHQHQHHQQHHRAGPVMLQQAGGGQLLLSSQGLQGLQGSVQLVASATNPGQYVLQTSGTPGAATAYMVAQPQTAVVHGQSQTVLVAQTPQQQGTPTKTIIILQQQHTQNAAAAAAATHHQKVVVTPQGQQMVVTQMPRPIVHTSSVTSNNNTGQGANSNNGNPGLGSSNNNNNNNNNNSSSNGQTTTVIRSNPAAVGVPQGQGGGAAPNVVICKDDEEVKPSPQLTMVAQPPVAQPHVPPVQQQQQQQQQPKSKPVRDLSTPFVCEWGDCNVDTKFKSANQVYMHACAAHCPTGSEEIVCQWDRCDNMKRKRFSLMTHLHDKHCNTEAMRQGLVRRKQQAHGGAKADTSSAATSTPHPGYAPDAALHAIKRHALEFVNPKELQLKPCKLGTASAPIPVTPRPGPPPPAEQDDNEGPVTKSIRLTASLILRNLVIYSSNSRRYLKHYEPHLANVALSNVESSRTIAQVLYDMNEGASHR